MERDETLVSVRWESAGEFAKQGMIFEDPIANYGTLCLTDLGVAGISRPSTAAIIMRRLVACCSPQTP